jgi:hypothetical protein
MALKLELDYIAGLFDGEGWFQIDRSPRKDTRRKIAHQLHARITMRDKILIDELQKMFSGSVRILKSRNKKHATYHSWDVCGTAALDFARVMESRLVIKKKQAQVAIEFQTFRATNINRPCDDTRFNRYESYYNKMRVLNKKGINHR